MNNEEWLSGVLPMQLEDPSGLKPRSRYKAWGNHARGLQAAKCLVVPHFFCARVHSESELRFTTSHHNLQKNAAAHLAEHCLLRNTMHIHTSSRRNFNLNVCKHNWSPSCTSHACNTCRVWKRSDMTSIGPLFLHQAGLSDETPQDRLAPSNPT